MRIVWTVVAAALVLVAGGLARWMAAPVESAPASPGSRRIISLAPSITETLFALGLGDSVAGVTRYCDFPPEAKAKPKVGGYFDTSFEAVVALQPDLIVTFEEEQPSDDPFAALGIKTLRVRHDTIREIFDSMLAIGAECDRRAEAERLVAELRSKVKALGATTRKLPRPRVLISTYRAFGAGGLKEVHVVGKNDYFDELLELAGGVNACQTTAVPYPLITAEGILQLDPEVILDLAPEWPAVDAATLLDDWKDVARVAAVRERRVYVLTESYVARPGPRFVQLLEAMIERIHPELVP
jgi:iron complex transport system substrate-binding protein